LMNWANVTLDYEDREVGQTTERLAAAQARMVTYGTELLQHKRTQPADDLLSVVTLGIRTR
jgi:cytochrome P450